MVSKSKNISSSTFLLNMVKVSWDYLLCIITGCGRQCHFLITLNSKAECMSLRVFQETKNNRCPITGAMSSGSCYKANQEAGQNLAVWTQCIILS